MIQSLPFSTLISGCVTALGVGVAASHFPHSITPLVAACFATLGHRLSQLIFDPKEKIGLSGRVSKYDAPLNRESMDITKPESEVSQRDSPCTLPPLYYQITPPDFPLNYLPNSRRDILCYQTQLKKPVFGDRIYRRIATIIGKLNEGQFQGQELGVLEYCIFSPDLYPASDLEDLLRALRKKITLSSFLKAALVMRLGKGAESFPEILKCCSDEEKQKLVLLAHIGPFPQFYGAPKTKIDPTQYEFNFLWLSDECPNEYLIGSSLEEVTKALFLPVSGWAIHNPETSITIYYDGNKVSEEVLENTRKGLLKEIKKSCPNRDEALTQFCDIRSIEKVSQSPETFSPAIPLFCRISLLKQLILDARFGSRDYIAFCDLDVQPMPPEALFGGRALEDLNKSGILLAKTPVRSGENCLIIVSGKNETIRDLCRKKIIEPSFQEAEKKLNNSNYVLNPQRVFGFYQESKLDESTISVQAPKSRFDPENVILF